MVMSDIHNTARRCAECGRVKPPSEFRWRKCQNPNGGRYEPRCWACMRSGNRSNRPRESSIWPAERIDSVRTCLLAGMTRLQTEQETGLTGNQLHYCRLRYLPELPAFARRGRAGKYLGAINAMRAEGFSIAQMAHKLGLSYEGVRSVCRRHGIKGTPSGRPARWGVTRQRRIAALSRQGMSAARIAAYLGESVDAVGSAMRRFGLFATSRRDGVNDDR